MGPDRRARRTSETTLKTAQAASNGNPSSRASNSPAADDGAPSGLSIVEKSDSGPGANAAPAQIVKIPNADSHASGRQRRDGSLPSGKTSGRNVASSPIAGGQIQP